MERASTLRVDKKKENHLETLIRHMTKYKIIKTNLRCFCISIFILALYFLIMAIVLTLYGGFDYLYSLRFDDKCEDLRECEFIWNLDTDLEAPVFILFGFEDFYVNHRSIALSVDEEQLIGQSSQASDLKETCGKNALLNADLVKLGHAEDDPDDEDYVVVKEVMRVIARCTFPKRTSRQRRPKN